MDTSTLDPSSSQCCGTTTSVMEADSPILGAEEQVSSGVVRLKLNKPQRDKKVKWSNDTIDNEHLGRKKSKCCCVYVPPKNFDESSSDESDMECEHCSGHVEKRNKEPPPKIKKDGSCLEWVRFSVPEFAVQEDDVLLTCEFDVQGERLYSVKWYKSGREFYRYVPGEWPPQQAFNQPGVKVDVSRSDDQHVALENVMANSGGRYKCEVLTEAPLFKTLVKSQQMSVIELPEGQPKVSGGRVEYRPGDTIHLNCTAPKSRPPASLTWFINEQQAPSDYLVEYASPADEGGREEPLLGLRFKAAHWHFHNGQLNLRCAARLQRFYVAEAMHNGVVIPSLAEENILEEIQFSSADILSAVWRLLAFLSIYLIIYEEKVL